MPRKKIKYILCPEYTYSLRDGERHYITAEMLVNLYGVDRSECVTIPRNLRGWRAPFGAKHLYPRRDGHYSLKGVA